MLGKVIWYSHDKGYGFIRTEPAGEKVFVHKSQIMHTPDHMGKELVEEEEVTFDVMPAAKGPRAHNVKRVKPNWDVAGLSPERPS